MQETTRSEARIARTKVKILTLNSKKKVRGRKFTIVKFNNSEEKKKSELRCELIPGKKQKTILRKE